jgi:hypothetical protein
LLFNLNLITMHTMRCLQNLDPLRLRIVVCC